MNRIYLPNYNLQSTLLGGQSFSWELIEDTYYGYLVNKVMKVKREGEYLLWQTYPQKDDYAFVSKYLNLDIQYDSIINKIRKDKYLDESINALSGLRILKQDFYQTVISFLISSVRNIKTIRMSVNLLRNLYGTVLSVDGLSVRTFPAIDRLAKLSLNELDVCKVGFRAKYISRVAKILFENNHYLEVLNDHEENYVRAKLIDLPGIGNKIADCIMAFSLGFKNITPIDVWTLRIFSNLYNLPCESKYIYIKNWYQSYFDGEAAIAGQYLFEFYRNKL